MGNGLNITFPGNLAQVDTAAELRLVPSYLMNDGYLYTALDIGGIFEFDASSLAADDNLTVIKPADRSPLQAGRWVKNADGFARGPAGATGPADNTYTTLAALLASDPTRKSARLVPAVGETAPAGNFSYVNGAWVRQGSDGIDYDGRTVAAKLGEIVSVTDARFAGGAIGDGSQSSAARNTAAFKAANAYLATIGGILQIPPGRYILQEDSGQGYCFRITGPVSLQGGGANTTSIVPADTVGDGCDTIRIEPNPAIACEFIGLRDLFIGDYFTGSRRGRHGIYIRTLQAGQVVRGFTVTRCFIARSTAATPGWAFKHDNDPAVHITGCLFAASFTESYFGGGLDFLNSGDSIRVVRNLISGPNIGVRAVLVNSAGGPASLLSILDNNITNDGGAIQLDAGPRTHIRRNNIENFNVGALAMNGGYVVNLRGASGQLTSVVFAENLIGNYGTSDATHLLNVGNMNGGQIGYNSILTGLVNTKAIRIEPVSGPQGTSFLRNTYPSLLAEADRIVGGQNGNGLIGILRSQALMNSWVTADAGFTGPSVSKDENGYVDFDMTVKSGTTPVVCNFGPGYRPPAGKSVVGRAEALGANGYSRIDYTIDASGDLTLSSITDKDRIVLRGRFRAAIGADTLLVG